RRSRPPTSGSLCGRKRRPPWLPLWQPPWRRRGPRCPPPPPRAPPAPPPGPGLSLPGVLHFIQHEWARFEAEKGRWEAERAELQAQVVFLQGERKGQENLKLDLVRRIRMLELALKQERSKYHKLKFGADPLPRRPEGLDPVPNGPAEVTPASGPVAWQEGRELLRQYLEEVGCGDTVLELRSRRLQSLLGRGAPPAPPGALLARRVQEQIQRNAGRDLGGPPLEDEDSDEDEDMESPRPPPSPPEQRAKARGPPPPEEEDEDDSEDALAEFDFLGSGAALQLGSHRDRLRPRETEGTPPTPPPVGPPCSLDGSLGPPPHDGFVLAGLGDLAGLSVPNEGCDTRPWLPRVTLRGHLDAVRGLAFHPAEPALLTASDDGTLKLWNLRKPAPPLKKNAAPDLEPVYTFRGHRGPVLAVACDSGLCCSGGLDARIRCWRLPGLDTDPYDGYDPGVQRGVLSGHSDAVWALALAAAGDLLASCSADGSVRLWAPRGGPGPCLRCLQAPSEHGVPTSLAFSATHPSHAVVAFRTGVTVLYDVEAARPVLVMESRVPGGDSGVNAVVSHPSQPLSITANDDRAIRFLDNRTGQVTRSVVAHGDAVTCLAIDPSGAFLMSGSHDCSVRLWGLPGGCSLQAVGAHRRKHHEGVLAVALHPRHPLLLLRASAGADGLATLLA
ncbi:striatin-4, partial [Phaenicophaeus curvirostris]|uniref:striatin-4 n=1 Tax=Phaenicophaeus curvirostris TaxID=33595 RepID=UPI0037F0F2A1